MQSFSAVEEIWFFEHSIECSVPKSFAWSFWTDVGNWALDADIESVELEGAFAAGARGVTQSKSSGRIEWQITEVGPGRAVIEFPAPGAVARFVWTFEEQEAGTRITQRVGLSGEQAEAYVDSIGAALASGIPAGMQKFCEAMQEGYRRTTNSNLPSERK